MMTNGPNHSRWIPATLLVGATYLVVGILFATLAGLAPSNQGRVAWRLTAWAISAVALAAHVAYEQRRLRSSRTRTASHAALAVGLGAFALAVAAALHAHSASTPQRFPAFALAVWPAMMALPAFVVALALATVLGRAPRR